MNPISSTYLHPFAGQSPASSSGTPATASPTGGLEQQLMQDVDQLVQQMTQGLMQGFSPSMPTDPSSLGMPGMDPGSMSAYGGPGGMQGAMPPAMQGGTPPAMQGGMPGMQAAPTMPGMQSTSTTPGMQGGMPQRAGGPSANDGAGAGEGLRDIKINSAAGGEALHLQEDQQGNLYNGSGNSVGVVNQDGSVTFNSGATQEMERLHDGGDEMAAIFGGDDLPKGHQAADGSVTWNASQVTVSAGDLDQEADF